jgi:hypothetical protein
VCSSDTFDHDAAGEVEGKAFDTTLGKVRVVSNGCGIWRFTQRFRTGLHYAAPDRGWFFVWLASLAVESGNMETLLWDPSMQP